MKNKLNIALVFSFIIGCNAKGVECSQQDVSCVKTDVDSDVSETNTTTINTTTVVNNSGGSSGSNNDSLGGSAGSEVGLSGSGGSFGGSSNTNYNDAGVVIVEPSDAGAADSGGSIPRVCDSATALSNDSRNWFTTYDGVEFFQLITPNGFSEDRCTYTGKIKWFYESTNGFWESDRIHDEPYTTFTMGFELNGDTKLVLRDISGTTYVTHSNMSFDGSCGPPGESEGVPSITITCGKEFRFYECFRTGAPNCHDFWVNSFRAQWDENLQRPVKKQITYSAGF